MTTDGNPPPPLSPTPQARNPAQEIGEFDPTKVAPGEVYRFLYTYYLHQDRQSWRRTETLLVVEVAALAGAHSLQGDADVLSVIALASGTVIAFLIGVLIYRDLEIRNSFFSHFDAVHERLNIRFTPKAKYSRGQIVLAIILAGVIIGNVLLACFAFEWSPWRIVRNGEAAVAKLL